METNTYKEIFVEWQQLVCYQDAQLMQDNEWDWEMELQEFVVNPQKALDKAKLIGIIFFESLRKIKEISRFKI